MLETGQAPESLQPDRESNITDEIGTLEANVNGIREILIRIGDLESKIKHGQASPEVAATNAVKEVRGEGIKDRLAAANLSIRNTSEGICQAVVRIEQLLGV